MRQLAAQQQVKAVVAIAGAGPFALTRLDRLLQRLVRRTHGEIEQGGGAAIERGAADLFRRCAEHVLVAARKRDRRAAMDMRVDPARNDDLPGRVDGARRASGAEAAGSADRRDFAADNADVGSLGAGRHDRQRPGNDQIEHAEPFFAANSALARRPVASFRGSAAAVQGIARAAGPAPILAARERHRSGKPAAPLRGISRSERMRGDEVQILRVARRIACPVIGAHQVRAPSITIVLAWAIGTS